jgi:ribose transport system permease protein
VSQAAAVLRGRRALSVLSEYSWAGLLVIVLAMVVIMAFVSHSFLSDFNIFVVLRTVATAVLIGSAQMVVLSIGQMNLSVGAIGGLAAITAGGIMDAFGLPVWLAIVGALACGAACGVINGIIVARTGLNAFIVTIATASVFLGLNLGLTSSQPFYDLDPGFASFGQARIGFFPLMGFITLAVAVALSIFFYRTLIGRQILAVGGNLSAARTAGIPVGRRIIWAHVISGLLAGTAGILWASQLQAAQPMIGQTWLLLSFAVPIIGGVALTGGSVRIIGTVLAALIIALINNSVVHLGIDPFYVDLLVGLLVLGAVWASHVATRTGVSKRTLR